MEIVCVFLTCFVGHEFIFIEISDTSYLKCFFENWIVKLSWHFLKLRQVKQAPLLIFNKPLLYDMPICFTILRAKALPHLSLNQMFQQYSK
jgi:hypothetical protein